MQLMRRLTAFFCTLCLLMTGLCACAEKNTEQEQKVVGTCAGYEVRYEELRYVTLSYKDKLEQKYGEGIWENPTTAEQYRAELESMVWNVMLNNYTVLAACDTYMGDAMRAGAMQDEEICAAVDAQIQEMKDAYESENAYRKALKEAYVTENLMRFTLTVAQLENELLYVLTQDLGLIEEDLEEFYDWLLLGNYVYVQHVFVSNDAGEDIEANRQKAEQLRQELLASPQSISEMIADETKDEDYYNLNPYYIVRDVYVESVEEAAFALPADWSVSPVIAVDGGFYVLVRMESNEQKLLSQAPTLLDSYQYAKVEEMVEAFRPQIALELNEYGKSIDLLSIV